MSPPTITDVRPWQSSTIGAFKLTYTRTIFCARNSKCLPCSNYICGPYEHSVKSVSAVSCWATCLCENARYVYKSLIWHYFEGIRWQANRSVDYENSMNCPFSDTLVVKGRVIAGALAETVKYKKSKDKEKIKHSFILLFSFFDKPALGIRQVFKIITQCVLFLILLYTDS